MERFYLFIESLGVYYGGGGGGSGRWWWWWYLKGFSGRSVGMLEVFFCCCRKEVLSRGRF